MTRLVCIANVRLPTEKAHGFQIVKMCEAFARNDLDVTLLHPYRHQFDPGLRGRSAFDYYGIRPLFQVRTLPNLDVVRLERFFPKGTFPPVFFAHALLWGLYAALVARREKAGLYYSRDSNTTYWLMRFGLPTVYEAHVVPRRAQRWLLQCSARHPALRLVVVLTSFIKERFVAMGFPAARVVVLPDGVDLTLFENLPTKEECRCRLGLPLDRTIVGYIGRFRTLEMEKGIPDLVQALVHLPSFNGRAPLLLCVGGPMDAVPAYLELARRLRVPEDRLKFIDRVPTREVPYWIRSFDLAAAPFPQTEHYAYFMSPLKIFEYMAAGAPIVATNLPSLREVLRHGENAWLVEADQPFALAQAIRMVINNPTLAARLARSAEEQVDNYTWERRVAAIINHEGILSQQSLHN